MSGNTGELRILWNEEIADSCFPSGHGKGKILIKIYHPNYHHLIRTPFDHTSFRNGWKFIDQEIRLCAGGLRMFANTPNLCADVSYL